MKKSFSLITFILLFVVNFSFATPYWSLEKILEFRAKKEKSELLKSNQISDLPLAYNYKNNSYPLRIAKIAHYLSVWQVKDPQDPEFGGMIEAESGDLADVVQTDNTLESIWVWCAYGIITGDTLKYKQNILDAWTYGLNFPAYNEEGTGSDYYRNHNCAWALLAEMTFRQVYGSTAYSNYAQLCADYIVNHPMNFSQFGYENIHPFVAGWCAGNLYNYGIDVGNTTYQNTAVTWGTNIKNWLDSNTANFSKEDWAMSSGTAIWGMCNSLFKNDPTQGQTWISQNMNNFEVFEPFANLPGFDWDSSWNVAYANSHSALFDITQDSTFYYNHLAITDTLISFDWDFDGAIPAESIVQNNEDMTWVSCYLALMGAGNTLDNLPQDDIGIGEITSLEDGMTFATNQNIPLEIRMDNFGLAAPSQLVLIEATLDGQSSQLNSFVDVGESVILDLGNFQMTQTGTYDVVFTVQSSGDSDTRNDTAKVSIEIVNGVQFSGQITNGTGVQVGMIFENENSEYFAKTDFNGNFSVKLPPDSFDVVLVPPQPFGIVRIQGVDINSTTTQNFTLSQAELILVDDDGGDEYEIEFMETLANLGVPFAYHENLDGVWVSSQISQLANKRMIYFTGDMKTGVLTDDEENALTDFLNDGGQLLISGKNIAESEFNSTFFQNYFKLSWNQNSTASTGFAFGVNLIQEFSGLVFYTGTGNGIDNQDADMDRLTILGTAGDQPVQIFNYDFQSTNPNSIGGTAYDGNYDVIFLGFGLEGIDDSPNLPQANTQEELLGAALQWFDLISDVEETENLPVKFSLKQNFPNPFNPTTAINYELRITNYELAKLTIYNILGEEVKEFALEKPVGTVVWNGTNQLDKPVSSGVYFYRLKAGKHSSTKKMLLLK